MDERDIKQEARLAAMEHLLMHHFAITTLQMSDSQFDQMAANWRSSLDRETFEGVDAAMSDLMSAEIRDAMLGLLDGIRSMRDDYKQKFGS